MIKENSKVVVAVAYDNSSSCRKVCNQYNHRLRRSGSTVVTMTSKANGKMEILTPCRSETPENIETIIGQNDYVMGSFNPANLRRNRSKVVRSPYSWNITVLWHFVIPSISFPSLFSCRRLQQKRSGQIFTIYTSNDAASPKDVPFEGFDEKKIVQGIKTP